MGRSPSDASVWFQQLGRIAALTQTATSAGDRGGDFGLD